MPFVPRRLTAAVLATALSSMTLAVVTTSPASAAGDAVDLGRAGAFAVLASSTVTNTGGTLVTGDLGLAPGTSVTGFPPGQVVGTTHVADATAVGAQTDARAAFTTANGLPSTGAAPVQLGGQTLTPGVYDRGALDLTGALTLDAQGNPDAVFVLRASSTLTTAATSTVTLTGSASACHVFWAVGSSATLGADSTFVGTIDAEVSVSVGARATVSGRLLALTGAVTLIDNTVTRPGCAAVVPPAAPAPAPVAPAPAPVATTPAPAATTPAPAESPSPTASPTPEPSPSPTGTPTASPTPEPAASPSPTPGLATASPTNTAPTVVSAPTPAPGRAVLPDSLTAPDAAPQPAPQAPAQPSTPTGSDSPGGPATGLPVTGLAIREAAGLGGLVLLLGGALMAAGSTPPKHRRPLLRGRRPQLSA